MKTETQLDLWVKGVPIHDEEAGGCVPDFSCCHPRLLAPFEIRVAFVLAFQEKRYSVCRGMYLIFLSAVEPNLNVEGFYHA